MKNSKTLRNIWIFAGIVFLFDMVLYTSSDGFFPKGVLWGVVGILSFAVAYNYHKKTS